MRASSSPAQREQPAPSGTGLSKLNSKRHSPSVDVDLGDPGISDDGLRRHRRAREPPVVIATGIPRKEVIQPQLPLRLPCYDFTPIINPTFDGSLPCGLGHRLRVLPTFVV